jgi:hypothetical protein
VNCLNSPTEKCFKDWGRGSRTEHLPSKHKALSSNHNAVKKKKCLQLHFKFHLEFVKEHIRIWTSLHETKDVCLCGPLLCVPRTQSGTQVFEWMNVKPKLTKTRIVYIPRLLWYRSTVLLILPDGSPKQANCL